VSKIWTVLAEKSSFTGMSSLYFHFPFCETKCHYCDFYSLGLEKTKEGDASTFERAIIREVELQGEAGLIPDEIETIFLGGGTPSMTPPESMERIFSTLFKYTHLAKNAEWTMEANPSSIELEQFKRYKAIGINRVSMGVQSLRNDHLAQLGRVHNESAALKALDAVFSAGITNVSTDLLCGVPGQTVEDLRSHLEQLTQFPLNHLSIYLLTLTKTHKMYQDLPNEDEQLKHLLFIDSFMREQGFEHYEISNFARPGFRAKHNLVYWQGGSYLSFGPSAHSYNAEKRTRFKNVSSLHKYGELLLQDSKVPMEWEESLNDEQLELEKWMLAVRLADGFPKSWLTNSNQRTRAEVLVREGFLEAHPSTTENFRATPKGFAMSDAVIRQLST
jgi:oxygen-independent coproporphyrinogen-3 oxidase